MHELGPIGVLETSTGLVLLSALFLLAALHSWWQERRMRRARRAKLVELPERPPAGQPTRTATADEEREPVGAGPAAPAPQEHEIVERPLLEIDGRSPGALAAARDPEGAAQVCDELGLSDDDTAEIVHEPSKASSPSVGDERIQRLEELVRDGEFEEAGALIAGLSDEAGSDRRLRRVAGHVALRRGNTAQAVTLLEACLEHAPGDLESRESLCEAHAELGDFEAVLRHARRGLEHEPRHGGLLLHLSEAAFELGAPEEALELANEALRARPEPESFFHLARLLAMTRRLTSHDGTRLREALERYPAEPALLHAAGVFEALYGRRAAALRILRSAAERARTARQRRAIEREIASLAASARASDEDAAA